MKYHYIILLGEKFNRSDNHTLPPLDRSLRTAGMACEFESASAKVFVSANAPILAIPGHGLVIGQIFTKDGQRIAHPANFDGPGNELSSHLLRNIWGEYLAFHVGDEDGGEVTVVCKPR